jgi:hypothetical protein
MRYAVKHAIFAAIFVSLAGPAGAQWLKQPTPGIPRMDDGTPDLKAKAPRTAAGTPDLSGVWQINGLGYSFNIFGDQDPQMLPWAEALYRERSAGYGKASPDTNCLPTGPRAGLFSQSLTKILQTPMEVAIMYEGDPTRQIFLDGRELPHDPNPSWMGYSTGRWEGDTLVVETAGYNDRTWLDLAGHPHSEALRVTERFHRTDFGHMDLQITFDDAQTYNKPWTIEVKANYVPDTELLEFICAENEKDGHHLVGHVDDERKNEVSVSSEILAQYAGVYRAGPIGNLRVSAADGQLLVELPGGGNHSTFAVADNRFVLPALGATLEFAKDANGQVSYMTIRVVEGDQRALRINER